MIKINLLGQRKKQRRRDEGGLKLVFAAGGSLLAAAAAVFFLVHSPLQKKLDNQSTSNTALEKLNKKLEGDTKDCDQIRSANEAAKAANEGIKRLQAARSTPSFLLWELANVMTPGRDPQLTSGMKDEMKSNPSRNWQNGWDAKNVWIIEFKEQNGKFTLDGGAQSDSDVTQLALRMQASMYFRNVVPKGGGEVADKESGLSYYKFTITGEVLY